MSDVSDLTPAPSRVFGFEGEHAFLSKHFVESHNLSAEHRFQKEKTLIMAERHAILDARTPEEAKALGRTVTLRPDWDDIKLDTMRTVAAAKFTEVRNPGFARRLANTGTAVLIETGDPFWGVDKQTGEGENHLGLILMELRAQLLTELSADEIAEMIAAQAALAPAPALPVLDQAILAALTVKGFTRQSVELRAAAIADSIRGRWDEIVAEVVPAAVAAQSESPVEEPVAEPEPVLVEPVAEPGAVEVPSVSSVSRVKELEPEAVLVEPVAEPGAVEVPSVSSEEDLEPEAVIVEPVAEPDEEPAPAEL